MEHSKATKYTVGVLVVSDTVFKQEKEDRSGINLEKILNEEKYFCTSKVIKSCVPDEKSHIEDVLINWCGGVDVGENIDLILTVGGTGFTPRDVTPEATKSIIEKEALHLATYMIIGCCEKTKFAALSRSVCGIRGRSLILNLPGSSKGSQECFEKIAPLLPHALDQLKGNSKNIIADHLKIQDGVDN